MTIKYRKKNGNRHRIRSLHISIWEPDSSQGSAVWIMNNFMTIDNKAKCDEANVVLGILTHTLIREIHFLTRISIQNYMLYDMNVLHLFNELPKQQIGMDHRCALSFVLLKFQDWWKIQKKISFLKRDFFLTKSPTIVNGVHFEWQDPERDIK